MKRIRPIFLFSFTLATAALLAACGGSDEPVSPDCTGDGIAIIPTATRQTDPDLFSPPSPPDGGDGADYCPTPIPTELPAEDFPEQFITTEVVNLSLDVANQDLAATAVGDDMLAAAWLPDRVDRPAGAGSSWATPAAVLLGAQVAVALVVTSFVHTPW